MTLPQWINKLTTIKARTENEIPIAGKKMIKIFNNIKKVKAPMEEMEKVKYFLPTSYKSKFILDSDITVDSLYNKIKENLKLWNYFNNWGNTTKEETHDDPMDIDYAGKFKGKGKQNKRINKIQKYGSNNKEQERNIKKGKEEKDKYCYICDMNNHDTKESYFNPKNSKSKFNKYYNENKKSNNKNYIKNKKYYNKRYIGYVFFFFFFFFFF